MKAILEAPWKAFTLGLAVAGILLALYLVQDGALDEALLRFALRWVHVVCAIIWVGLVFFVNFVMIPANYAIDDAGRAVLAKWIAPGVAMWFRQTSHIAVAAGLLLAWMNGYLLEALTLGAIEGFAVPKHVMIGLGMWIGIAMWVLVHHFIWPNMRIMLGLVPDKSKEERFAARVRMRNFARMNLVLSLPVTFAMVAARSLY